MNWFCNLVVGVFGWAKIKAPPCADPSGLEAGVAQADPFQESSKEDASHGSARAGDRAANDMPESTAGMEENGGKDDGEGDNRREAAWSNDRVCGAVPCEQGPATEHREPDGHQAQRGATQRRFTHQRLEGSSGGEICSLPR